MSWKSLLKPRFSPKKSTIVNRRSSIRGRLELEQLEDRTLLNQAPILNPIGRRPVNEQSLLSFTATASDADMPTQSLTFSLDAGAPAGASITPAGMFSWTPTEMQGPGSYQITIRVTDNGTQP